MTNEIYKNSKILLDGFVNTVVKSVIDNIVDTVVELNKDNIMCVIKENNTMEENSDTDETDTDETDTDETGTDESDTDETGTDESDTDETNTDKTNNIEESSNTKESDNSNVDFSILEENNKVDLDESSSDEEKEDDSSNSGNFTTFNFVVEDSLIDYIDSLDVYILSPGGVGSNYITDFLLSQNFNVRPDLIKCQDTCHYPYKMLPHKKTIYLYGDVKNAVTSQYKRELLHYNATKLQLKRDYDHETLGYFIKTFPDDPLGIKKQYDNLKNTPNTAMVQYPYTVDSMKEAFDKLYLKVDMSDFIVKDRMNYNITEEYYNKNPILKQLLNIYEDIVFD